MRIEESESWKNCSVCYLCNEKFDCKHRNCGKLKNYVDFTWKFRGVTHNICNLWYSISWEISAVLYNEPKYEFYFMILFYYLTNAFK